MRSEGGGEVRCKRGWVQIFQLTKYEVLELVEAIIDNLLGGSFEEFSALNNFRMAMVRHLVALALVL